MKSVWYTVMTACFILMLLMVGRTVLKFEQTAFTAKDAYAKGYEAGKKAAVDSLPKACVTWWFGDDARQRHREAVQAYCKGKL